jgi:putative aldouronate transport system permease protein
MTLIRRSKDVIIFNIIAYTSLGAFSMLCLMPFLIVLSGSVTQEKSILEDGYRLIPKVFSLNAYKTIFIVPKEMLTAYMVTIFVTVVGTISSLFLTAMTSYVLQKKTFKYRYLFAFYFYFTTLFSGGLVPWYIMMIRYLGMKNNILALILPGMFGVFYIIIFRSFMSSIPDSISESASMDGAGEFTIFTKLMIPMSKPALATIGLFIALGYWNDWFNAMLFINNNLKPLQYYLYTLLTEVQMLRNMARQVPQLARITLPEESLKMAMTVVTIGPIMILYPSIQKYFVKGIILGAVKG